MINKILITIIGVLVALSSFLIGTVKSHTFGTVTAGNEAYACTASTTQAVAVGNQLSTVIIATSSNRAAVVIEQPKNATNTVSIALNNGTAAVVNGGFQLTPATTTSPVSQFRFGLNTDYPYTGQVTAITDTGSTTVLVTSCTY